LWLSVIDSLSEEINSSLISTLSLQHQLLGFTNNCFQVIHDKLCTTNSLSQGNSVNVPHDVIKC
jgi:hypothetical protein